MKRSYLALIVSIMVLLTTIIWLLGTKKPVNAPSIIQYVILMTVIGFGIFFGISGMISEKQGEQPEDEMSKKIMQKASSVSFYISTYLWLALMYISDKTRIESHTLIGAGILGMVFMFCICWIIIKTWGTKDE